MAQLVAVVSDVVLGSVAKVVGSNLARGEIFISAQLIHYIPLIIMFYKSYILT